MAAPKAMTSAMFGVPASNLFGSAAYVLASYVTLHDHLAAAEERVHRVQQVALAVQHADARRAQHLVRREREEVAVEVLHVDRHVRHALRAIDQHDGAEPVRERGDLLDRVDRAEHVRHLRDGDDLRLRADLRQHVVPDQLARRRRYRCSARVAPVSCAIICHGTRLLWCSIAVKTISSPGLRNLRPQACATRLIDSVVLRVKMISSLGMLGVDEAPGLQARRLVRRRRLFGERVQAAVDVRVVVLVVVHERVDHLARLLRRRGVVEIHERLAVHLPVEDGEVFAYLRVDVDRSSSDSDHQSAKRRSSTFTSSPSTSPGTSSPARTAGSVTRGPS